MKSSRRPRFFSSSSSTTVVYTFQNYHSAPVTDSKITEIPIQSQSKPVLATVDDHIIPKYGESAAAVKIQAVYRSHMIRRLFRKITAVDSEADYWERLIQRQDTVDAVRSSERERIRINEALMGLLLRLDSVPGIDPNIRELRRNVSRRIIGLQEILDAVSDTKIDVWNGFSTDWDEILETIEKDVCKEIKGGGSEMERFCAENLGFRCLQRFLSDQ